MIIGIVSVMVYTLLIAMFIYEAVLLAYLYWKHEYIYNNKQHSVEHIIYCSTYWLGNIWLVYWLFSHAGVEHGFDLHLVEEGLSYVLVLLSVSGLMLWTHIRKERKNSLEDNLKHV